jgi:hypothetical protein
MAGGAGDDISKKAEAAVSDAAAAASDAAGGLADSFKDLRLGERFKGLLRAYNEVEEKGTPLRPYIRSARESVNDAAVSVKVRACVRACGVETVVWVGGGIWGKG